MKRISRKHKVASNRKGRKRGENIFLGENPDITRQEFKRNKVKVFTRYTAAKLTEAYKQATDKS